MGLLCVALAGWALALYSCADTRTKQKQIELAATAYKYPRVEIQERVVTKVRTVEHLVVQGSGTVRELADGTREVSFAGMLTTDTTRQAEADVARSSTTAPVLPPDYLHKPPSRLVWIGYADGWEAGAGLRVWGELHLAAGILRRDADHSLAPTGWVMARF